MRIGSKAEFFRLWTAGCLGNKLRTWSCPLAWSLEKDRPPSVGFREIGKAGGGKFVVVPAIAANATLAEWQAEGRKFIICESAPDEKATIQGEVMRATDGLRGFLHWPVTDGMRMRDSMKLAKDVRGLAVRVLLERFMDPGSRDDLEALWDLYPDATVEFTCYSVGVGEIPGRNTIFWETRDY